jgi:D-glycero-D-manno-heptose 1,7-bisphosphate phosphatase
MVHEKFTSNYDLVIFDRDGVINFAPKGNARYILSVEELDLNEMIIDFILELQGTGVETCVATNQQCVGKRLISVDQLNRIHNAINIQIRKAGGMPLEFFTCPHLIEEECECRKPKPGLLINAMSSFGVTPDRALFIGDQLSDKIAAESAALDFLFVENIDFP